MARLLALVLLLAPASALADAIPSCPEGQHFQANPLPPNAMHHAGGQCVADAGAESDDCSVASGGPLVAVALLALGLVLTRRRTRRLPV
jgi:MYXO-CTERM domain-containing protein